MLKPQSMQNDRAYHTEHRLTETERNLIHFLGKWHPTNLSSSTNYKTMLHFFSTAILTVLCLVQLCVYFSIFISTVHQYTPRERKKERKKNETGNKKKQQMEKQNKSNAHHKSIISYTSV